MLFRSVIVLHENGSGTIEANNWYLDLDPGTPKAIPADRIPAFLVIASGTELSLTASIRFRTQDVGRTAGIFVFARVPRSAVSSSRSAAKDGANCVLVQVDPNTGQTQPASASSLQAYTSGVLSAQGQSVTILNSVANSDRKSTRLNSSHIQKSRMPSSA